MKNAIRRQFSIDVGIRGNDTCGTQPSLIIINAHCHVRFVTLISNTVVLCGESRAREGGRGVFISYVRPNIAEKFAHLC